MNNDHDGMNGRREIAPSIFAGPDDDSDPPDGGFNSSSAATSTPFGITASTTGVALTSSGCSAMIADMAGDGLTSSGVLDVGIASAIEEEGGQAILRGILPADIPLAPAIIDDLVTALVGPALRATLDARVRQIVNHGHRSADDLALPLTQLPALARSIALDSMDLLNGPARNLEVARRKLAKAAAVLMAAIDVVDAAIAAAGTGA